MSRARTPSRLALCLLALFSALASARLAAHDIYEASANALLRPDALEIGVTMAQATALRLIDPDGKTPVLTAENFAAHRAALLHAAAALFVVTAGKKPLAATQAEVELTDENDLVFKILYPRPPPGRLHFHAAFVKKLGPGYGGILEATGTTGNHLGWEQLSFENPNLEVTVPPPSAPKKS